MDLDMQIGVLWVWVGERVCGCEARCKNDPATNLNEYDYEWSESDFDSSNYRSVPLN